MFLQHNNNNNKPYTLVKKEILAKYPKQGNGEILSFNNRVHNILDDMKKAYELTVSEQLKATVFVNSIVQEFKGHETRRWNLKDYIELKIGLFSLKPLYEYIGHIPDNVVNQIEVFKTISPPFSTIEVRNEPYIIAPKSLFINGEDVRVIDPILLYPIYNIGDKYNIRYFIMVAQWD